MSRRQDVDALYSMLNELRDRCGGFRYLRDCTGRSGWPQRGIYFFFTEGEYREDGKQLRVVRVGTHAVTLTATSSLWSRLRTHRGALGRNGGGNHRGSIFRKRVGAALLRSNDYPDEVRKTWGIRKTGPQSLRLAEKPLEGDVSAYIGAMPFLWLDVADAPGPTSQRAFLERNCIALLSNYEKPHIDPPSPQWLGLQSEQCTIRESGLWNTNYVDDNYHSVFLDNFSGML